MPRVTMRFYAHLNDFLPYARRQVAFEHDYAAEGSVKDLIESLGVPHTEVDLILVNERPASFAYLVREGDRISVYPPFSRIDLGGMRLAPDGEIRFVLDIHLGRLASHLRLLGFDTIWRNDIHDPELAQVSSEQNRILLTRDLGLLKRRIVTYGYYVRATQPRKQLAEVIKRYQLLSVLKPFTRCLNCNGPIEPVDKAKILDRLEANTRQYYDEFYLCPTCDQLYWKGSHYTRMLEWIEGIRREMGNETAE